MALVENGLRVLFARTTDLVQKLQVARRDLQLEAAIAKLDKYHLLILDDIAYVTKDQAETSVIFELIAARYERRSLFITANQPFGEWGQDLPRSGHDPRRRRSPRPPRDDLRDECRELPQPRCRRAQAGPRPTANARDTQILILIVAHTRKRLRPCRATTIIQPPRPKILILIVAPLAY